MGPWTKASPLKSVLKTRMKSRAETTPPGPASVVTCSMDKLELTGQNLWPML